LPHVVRFNLPAIVAERWQTLAAIIGLPAEAGADAIVERLTRFVQGLGLPTRLSQLGVSLEGLDWALIAEETTRMVLIKNNPRPASVAECHSLLQELRQA
jgi:alcohol dehydrogenase class IV